MANERVIHAADLSKIENSLYAIQNDVHYVSNQVNAVSHDLQETQSRLDQLISEFHDFIRKDQLDKNLQLAETRIVKVRQELENNFGHYDEVRRRATGILQAVDASLVKKETIENTTEEHMLAAPRYWLAPCLVALASWLNDNQELAERAMLEALRRDDEKTSLFFALVTRRGARYKASREWLDRYFGLQDPHHLEREIVILIDGFSNGVFGPEARMKCGRQIEAWIEELATKVGFVEEQHQQWKDALEAKKGSLDEESYSYLREYSTSWSQLERSLEGARLHGIILDYFTAIFAKEVSPAQSIAYAVDALLDTLVSKFDDEELPLRKDERLYSLIIQENGDRGEAQRKFDVEKTLEQRVSFTQLLTNFAMYPQVSNASLATQKLSIALSKEWIRMAHDDITVENRASVPNEIHFEIDSWEGTTIDGTNEEELLADLTQHLHDEKVFELANIKLRWKHWAALGAGIAFTFMGFGTTFLWVLAVLSFLYFYFGKRSVKSRKEQLVQRYAELLVMCKDVLRAVLADVVDWRKEYEREDQKSIHVTELLESISPEQYAMSSHDQVRAVIQ
ncbi:hypothetical protein [Brevibacillus centrosporus]|uniref:hypothetical protein n=1 Tax=Brevibacillus centrosporus TaxID=54910 RepID=UPI002E1AE6A5|nr:hypothetical protein [Brevibacillus centrosporus]